jgi:beta-alanine--pyruvate transaminase
MMTTAKGLTNAAVPAAAVFTRKHVHEAFMQGPEHMIELFHGYTYSAHALACAAGLATLDLYRDEGIFENAASLSGYWEDAVHSLKGLPNVIDIRNIGIMAAVELSPREGAPTKRGYDVFVKCYEQGLMCRLTGDTIALSPPLILTKQHIDEIFGILAKVIKEVE